MSAAKAYADARATADLRMGVIAMHPVDDPSIPCERDPHGYCTRHQSQMGDGAARCDAMRSPVATGPGEVWCAYCPERATVEVRLTSGETRAYCGHHLTRLTVQTPLGRIEKTWQEAE